MRTSELTIPFEIKEATDDGRISGYGAVFENVDRGFDKIKRGAFKDTLRQLGSNPLPMLWQHMSSEPIGVWDQLRETRKGLHIEGQLNLSKESGQADVPEAWKARALAKQRAVSGLSIGYIPVDFKYEDDVRVLTKVELMEVSMATFPMNPEAQMTAVKELTNKQFVKLAQTHFGLTRNEAEALRAHGLSGLRDYAESPSTVTAMEKANRLKNILEDMRT